MSHTKITLPPHLARMTPEEREAYMEVQANNLGAFVQNTINTTIEHSPAGEYIVQLNVDTVPIPDRATCSVRMEVHVDIIYEFEPRLLDGTIAPVMIERSWDSIVFFMRKPIMMGEKEGDALFLGEVPETEGGRWFDAGRRTRVKVVDSETGEIRDL
ncbi:hypothetical protein LTR53_009075 [Teratosphaeriaceae sp. CCFEE 6253]|nr:hypothetical protein LTR53_009075 [Teratosphaeriaceae sp. CCFEE 6253]